MAMLFGAVTVPYTDLTPTAKAVPIVSIGGVTANSIAVTNQTGETREIVTGYTTMCPVGTYTGTIYIFAKPEANPADNSTWPTVAQVVAGGMPVTVTLPFYIQDPGGVPTFPDMRRYFVAKTGLGAAELRIGS